MICGADDFVAIANFVRNEKAWSEKFLDLNVGIPSYWSATQNVIHMIFMSKKRRRHSPEQIVSKIRESDVLLNPGKDLASVLRSLEVCEANYHRWRNQFGGMKCEKAKRLCELDIEDASLKRLLAGS